MIFIRRAVTLTAAAAMAALVSVAASACGGAATATRPTTNGLEKKSAAEVLQDAAAALNGAKSVHVVLTGANGDHGDVRIQGAMLETCGSAGKGCTFPVTVSSLKQ